MWHGDELHSSMSGRKTNVKTLSPNKYQQPVEQASQLGPFWAISRIYEFVCQDWRWGEIKVHQKFIQMGEWTHTHISTHQQDFSPTHIPQQNTHCVIAPFVLFSHPPAISASTSHIGSLILTLVLTSVTELPSHHPSSLVQLCTTWEKCSAHISPNTKAFSKYSENFGPIWQHCTDNVLTSLHPWTPPMKSSCLTIAAPSDEFPMILFFTFTQCVLMWGWPVAQQHGYPPCLCGTYPHTSVHRRQTRSRSGTGSGGFQLGWCTLSERCKKSGFQHTHRCLQRKKKNKSTFLYEAMCL